MKDDSNQIDLTNIIRDYEQNLKTELKELWNSFEIDLSQKEQYEVIGGILARQITITIQFLSNTSIWTGDLAPIILRSLADNYINLAWILENPLERAQKFIYFGLGQEKLMMEHRRKQIENEGSNPDDDELIQFSEKWINSHRYTFLTDVNLGSWSGISTREMAEQANCLDFYNYVYQPFSSAVHNTWNHIARYNLKVSENILHKFLKTPIISDINVRVDYLELAAKYTDKCFMLYYKRFPSESKRQSSYDILMDNLSKIFNSENNNGSA